MSEFEIFKRWLKNVSFLTDDDCVLFEPFLQTRNYENRQLYLEEGNICKTIGFTNKGSFRTYYLNGGKEFNTDFTFENEFVTDYDSFLQAKPSRYYIQAMEDSQVVVFDLPALQNAYSRSKNWERFGRIMAEQAYTLTARRVGSFLFMDGKQRYLELIKTSPHLIERIPLYHIASYLGLERESLSRLRKKITGRSGM